jgi:hypothetical protein
VVAEDRVNIVERKEGRRLFGGQDMFISFIVVTVSQLYTYNKNYQIIHFEKVQLILYQSYFNEAIKNKTK